MGHNLPMDNITPALRSFAAQAASGDMLARYSWDELKVIRSLALDAAAYVDGAEELRTLLDRRP